jgi:hypothetical protein
MIQKLETRADRLNWLCLQAKWAVPISLEERACLERAAHFVNLPKGDRLLPEDVAAADPNPHRSAVLAAQSSRLLDLGDPPHSPRQGRAAAPS